MTRWARHPDSRGRETGLYRRCPHFPGFRPNGGFGSWHFFSPSRALTRKRLPLGA
jgi:hypothetical protein